MSTHLFNASLGERIAHHLSEVGMSKAEFGRRIGTSRQNVNTLLRKTSMDTSQLATICKVLSHDFFQYIERPQKELPKPKRKVFVLLEVPGDHHKEVIQTVT